MTPPHPTPPFFGPYRVLDLTDDMGFACGKVLADMGMDVIKVEPPGGDLARRQGPFAGDGPPPETSLPWLAYNTSKRSITPDLERAEGRDIFKRLAARAEFVIESFPPGYLDGLGLGYAALSGINPGIIMTSISPFGAGGPHRDYRASNLVAEAAGGLSYITGDPDRAPLSSSMGYAYVHAGLQAAVGSLIAHYHKQMTCRGQHVDVSIQESVAVSLYYAPQSWNILKEVQGRYGPKSMRERGQITRLLYSCKDGFVLWRLLTSRLSAGTIALVRWMEEKGKAGYLAQVDWEGTDIGQVSQEQLTAWEDDFGVFLLTKTMKELDEQATRRGIAMFPVNTVADVLKDPQLAARHFWVKLDDSGMVYPGLPVVSDEASGRMKRAPWVGEHSGDILAGELGLSQQEMDGLKCRGII